MLGVASLLGSLQELKMGPLNFRGTEVINIPRWPSEWASLLPNLELKSGKRTG